MSDTDQHRSDDFTFGRFHAGMMEVPTPATERPALPGYEVHEKLDEGGMGIVYRATEKKLQREVATKLILPRLRSQPDAAARFRNEARIAARLDHPNIPPVYALGEQDDGTPFLVMKRVAGGTLHSQLDARKNPADDRARFVEALEHVASAIGHAHSRGIIHRDVKPANVMLEGGKHVFVMDWGLAKTVSPDDPMSHVTSKSGTPGYRSPEQEKGEPATYRSDVYALGGILCVILTGVSPAAGGIDRLMELSEPAELVALARECLQEKPSLRPEDGRAVASRVNAYRMGVDENLKVAREQQAAAKARASEAVLRLQAEERERLATRKRWTWVAGSSMAISLLAIVGISVIWVIQSKRTDENHQAEVRVQAAETERTVAKYEADRRTQAAETNRLREAYEAAARLALQQGDFSKALAQTNEAIERHLPLSPETQLARARAFDAIGDYDGLRSTLKGLNSADLPPAIRGQALLLHAELALLTDTTDGLRLLTEAEAAGISDADRAFVQAVRTERTPDAMALFEKAIRLDPRHLPAREALGLMLVLHGRFDDLDRLVRESRLLYPNRPGLQALQAAAKYLQGDEQQGDTLAAELRGKIIDPGIETALVLAKLAAWIKKSSPGGDWNPLEHASHALPAAQQIAAKNRVLNNVRSCPPYLRPVLRVMTQYVMSTSSDAIINLNALNESFLAGFRKNIGDYPERTSKTVYASFLFIRMTIYAQDHNTSIDRLERLCCEAADAALDAYKTPGFVDSRSVLLDLAITSYLIAGSNPRRKSPEPRLLKRAAGLIDERFRLFGAPQKIKTLSLMTQAAIHQENDAITRKVVSAWAAVQPDSEERTKYEAELAFRDEADAKAIRLAERALSVPNYRYWFDRMMHIRESAAARLGRTLTPLAPLPHLKRVTAPPPRLKEAPRVKTDNTAARSTHGCRSPLDRQPCEL